MTFDDLKIGARFICSPASTGKMFIFVKTRPGYRFGDPVVENAKRMKDGGTSSMPGPMQVIEVE
jgi:hypothetical protein